jgi:hypothetical protein
MKLSDRQKVSNERKQREDTEIVIELGMTASQFKTLRWVLICWLGQYGENEFSKYKTDVEALSNALEGAV